jgi:type IV secretory pathway component VirB8
MTARDLLVTKAEEKAYYKAASAWDIDINSELRKSRRTAWRVAVGSVLIAGLTTTALTYEILQSKFEWGILAYDKITGITTPIVHLKDYKAEQNEVLTKAFIQRVVQCRENYTRATANANWKECRLFTAADQRKKFDEEYSPSNPNSPWSRLGEYGTAAVGQNVYISFTPDAPNVAQARFVITETVNGVVTQAYWRATITFLFVEQPAEEVSRNVNPLGLQVNYRKDPDGLVEIKQL